MLAGMKYDKRGWIKVQVRAKHKEHGVRKRCNQCPVALAVLDALKGTPREGASVNVSTYIGVGATYLQPWNISYKISMKVQKAIHQYDTFGEMEPFSFYMMPAR